MIALTSSTEEGRRAPFRGRDGWPSSVVTDERVELPRSRDAPRLARRSVQRKAAAALDHYEREMVEVLMSELVSNAVVHPPERTGDNVMLRFAVTPERIRVEVRDAGAGFSPADMNKSRSEPGGYGLLMVERGASRWGTSDRDGNCVWFELDRGGSYPA